MFFKIDELNNPTLEYESRNSRTNNSRGRYLFVEYLLHAKQFVYIVIT